MAQLSATVKQLDQSASEGIIRDHRVVIDRPEAKGGSDAGPMGGELLLAALGGCFMSNLLEAIRTRSAPIQNAAVELNATTADSPARFTAIELIVSADYAPDQDDQFQKLIVIAERACIVANTLKAAVTLTITHRKPSHAVIE